MTVKRQHYIWRKYLSKWSDGNDLLLSRVYIYRKRPKGKQNVIENDSLKNVGFEKFYYDISGYNERDIRFCKAFLEHFQKNEKVQYEIDTTVLCDANKQRDYLERNVVCFSEEIENKYRFLDRLEVGDSSFYHDSKRTVLMKKLKRNILLSLYGMDTEFIDVTEALECMHVKDDEVDYKYEFLNFFWTQYFRSPKLRANEENAIVDSFKRFYGDIESTSKAPLSKKGIKLFRAFFLMLVTLKVSYNMAFEHDSRITIIKNRTSIPFVTGDSPIVSIKKDDTYEYWYPISPETGVLLQLDNGNENLIEEIVKEDKIGYFNNLVAENAFNEIYSDQENVFEQLSINAKLT